MKNIKIRAKLIILAMSAAVLIISVWFLSITYTKKVSIGSDLYNEIILSNQLTADILPPPEYILEAYCTALKYTNENDADKRQELLTDLNSLKQEYEERHSYWESKLSENNELKQTFLTDSYQYASDFYTVFENEVVPAVNSEDNDKINKALSNLENAYKKHRDEINSTVVLSQKWQDDTLSKSKTTQSDTNRILIIIVSISILINTLISVSIIHSLVTSTKHVSGILNKIAEGDLSAKIDEKYITRDEIGQLCASTKITTERLNGYIEYINEIKEVLQTMADGDMRIHLHHDYIGEFSALKEAMLRISSSLNETFSTISVSASQVNVGAEQVSVSAQQLSQGATEQASTIEELSSGINDILNQVSDTSNNASNAKKLAEKSVHEVLEGNIQMNNMVSAMNDINNSSSEISKIIKVIDDIAFQTNILALNAAVEAARAGSAGKGFAVVADEVRNLAAKSADAAKNVTVLIETSIKKVNEGTKIADITSASLKNTVENFNSVSELINLIDISSSKQSEYIANISKGMEQISAVVQTNSATAEESAATSEELSGQSATLAELISKIKFDASNNSQYNINMTHIRKFNKPAIDLGINNYNKY